MGGTVKIDHGRINEAQLTYAPSGALLVGNPHIIFDGKSLEADRDDVWEEVGTGTHSYSTPLTTMSVTSGQYAILNSVRTMPYFAGYPIYAEFTFDTFAPEAGVTKRVGYFSSSAVAPHNSALDGFWLESDGTTYRIKASRGGTLTANIPFSHWHGRKILKDYDWDNFTVIMFDHLWLGGAALRMWVATSDHGWVLAHSVPYVGNYQGPIINSPQHFMRYDIYSSTGSGSFRANCCQFSVLGDVSQNSNVHYSVNTTGISCSSTSSVYALKGIKKIAAHRNIGIRMAQIGSSTASTNDTGILYLLKNPTLSAPLSYSADHSVDIATATNQTVTSLGEVIAAVPSSQSAGGLIEGDYLGWLTQKIDNTFDEYVLAFSPSTTNQTLKGILAWKEYG